MDGAAASAIDPNGAENNPRDGDTASGIPSAEATADRVFCCRDCGEGFGEEAAYLEHQHQHQHQSDSLVNRLDSSQTAKKDDETVDYCTWCSLSFVEPSEFLSHMEKSHGQTSHKESSIKTNPGITKQHTYECPDCGKCYGVIGHFLNHQRSHRQASKSVFHDLEHLKKKSFQCESCGRNYSRASALDAHRRCHEEKLVKSRSRSSGDALHVEESHVEAKRRDNETVDTPEKTFKCSCGKAFAALMRLKTHQRFSRNSRCSPEEMKDKPKKSCSEFYCGECKKAFSGHIALFNHQRWHSNHANDPANRFPCDECGKVFMTQTFYHRHQRTAHSDETPAKSFLHQVCQLQKKAFECDDCGLKFSRASALHSHRLHHTDVFRETEKEAPMQTSLPAPQETAESEAQEAEPDKVESENVLSASVVEEDVNDEDVESYDPGDFNVQVISASESEDEHAQDLNPDLELLCESDQEVRDDGDVGAPKPEMDFKIVEIDFEQTDERCAASEAENKAPGERFDCPDCYRWFSSPASLRVHRMWHGVRKRKRQPQGQSVAAHACGHEPGSCAAHCSDVQPHKSQDTSNDEAEGSEGKILSCNECGKCFTQLSALVSHQRHHPKRAPFQCPDCSMSYSHAAGLFNHMRNCAAPKKENISLIKKEYNPKKTLLGPKIYHCEQCGKGFWSLGAYSHHKQSPAQCADSKPRKDVTSSVHSVNGHPRFKVACPVCGRKFRHKGIMALHMRKHENGNHTCELCSRSFRLFSSLLRHQVVHNDQLLPPPIKSFQHQVEQLKKNTYSCPDCGKLFSRAKALQFHMKSHGYETGRSPSSPRSTVLLEDLQCPTCLAHFNNKASLRAHQKLCIKRDSQAVCCKTEPSEDLPKNNVDAALESPQHIAVHANAKHEMDLVQLDTEKPTHEGPLKNPRTTNLKYKCKKCDRSFSVVGALNFHKRVHAEDSKSQAKAKGDMPAMLKKPKQEEPSKELFHCAECGRRFMSNSALGSHRRWHKEKKLSRPAAEDLQSLGHKAEEGPFQCPKCRKHFFNHRVFRRHQIFNPLCHPKTSPHSDPGVASEFSCPECYETFENGSRLAAHCENVHGRTAGHQGPGPVEVNQNGRASTSSGTLRPKAHQCPLCSMTFAKARGLRAHGWQAHTKRTKGKNKAPSAIKTESVASGGDVAQSAAGKSKGKKKIPPGTPFAKLISCLDCGKQCGSPGVLLDHKRVCPEMRRECKRETPNPETAGEVPPPLGRLSEHTAKCLFKCGKCGKAFQTEEQLGAHRTKARIRPYCCALCCHGFWTEGQLQQHLTWHDEVRYRLPNEVRLRLSAAMTSAPPKADHSRMSWILSSDGQLQSSHKCQHCGKAFLSPAALQRHETQHCNNDSYHCSICPRTFSEIQDLIDHHQECVGEDRGQGDAPAAVSPGDPNSLTCLECGTTFCQETDLHQHCIEHTHGVNLSIQHGKRLNQGSIGCNAFKTHLHQPGPPVAKFISCLDCGKQCTSPFVLLDHKKVCPGIPKPETVAEVSLHLHQHTEEEEEEDVEDDDDDFEEDEDEEEEAAARTGDNMISEAELDSGREDHGGGADACDQSRSLDSAQRDEASGQLQNHYACSVCGMVCTNLVTFRKHRKLHGKAKLPKNRPESSVQGWNRHRCPECGISFIRRARLLRHMRLHRKLNLGCDQCDRVFPSVKMWQSHVRLHQLSPFWCLRCARGFKDKERLDTHAQKHNVGTLTCNICHKNFGSCHRLKLHYISHTRAKPYQCAFCGEMFTLPGRLTSHQKRDCRSSPASRRGSLSITKSANIPTTKKAMEGRTPADAVKEERRAETSVEEVPVEGKGCSENEAALTDCGEPVHHFNRSTPLCWAQPLPPDEVESETAWALAGEVLHEPESPETKARRDFKWECVECDMGFDEVGELHWHYMKHATGELPMTRDDIES